MVNTLRLKTAISVLVLSLDVAVSVNAESIDTSSANKKTDYADFVYGGTYTVTLQKKTDKLSCRAGAGVGFAVIKRLKVGSTIKALEVVNPEKPWFYTSLGCYIRASSAFLKWSGVGENPSSMCDWRVEPC